MERMVKVALPLMAANKLYLAFSRQGREEKQKVRRETDNGRERLGGWGEGIGGVHFVAAKHSLILLADSM